MHILHVHVYVYGNGTNVWQIYTVLTLTCNVRSSCQKSDHQNTPNSHLQHIEKTKLWRTGSPSRSQPTVGVFPSLIWALHLDKVFRPSLSAKYALKKFGTLLTDVCLLYILYKATKKHHVKYGEITFMYIVSKNRFRFQILHPNCMWYTIYLNKLWMIFMQNWIKKKFSPQFRSDSRKVLGIEFVRWWQEFQMWYHRT